MHFNARNKRRREQKSILISKKEKENIRQKINENKITIGKLNTEIPYENVQADDSTISNLEDYNNKLENLKSIVEDIKRDFSKDVKREIYRGRFKPIDNNNATFNHDVILLVDSNLNKINSEILNPQLSGINFFCPTLKHIDELLDNITIISQPKTIFLHSGTNQVDM